MAALALVAIVPAMPLATAAADKGGGGKTYRWVDSQGVVHYGDRVPQEYARHETAELNQQGILVRTSPAQLSASEARDAEEQAAAAARQRQHDQFLLATYTSVRDIEQLRDERVGLIDAQITAARGFLKAAQTRMQTLQDRAMKFAPYSAAPNARRLPDILAEEIVRALAEERAQQAVIEQKILEKTEMRDRFQVDIERYQALIARRASAAR